MAKLLIPSSFECNCGHESNFFESTVREMETISKRKKIRLSDGENDNHTIVFDKGNAVEIICPKLGKCKITEIE